MTELNELDLDFLVRYIDTVVSQETDAMFGSLYIFGSFGDRSATTSSDIDIIVGLVSRTENEIKSLESYFKHDETYISGVSVDVVVKDEKDVKEYLMKACRMGQYDTVYNLRRNKYVEIDNIETV